MTGSFDFETYTHNSVPEIIKLWNSSFPGGLFPLTERFWKQQTEGDPDFEPNDISIVRDKTGSLAGLGLIKIWRGKGASVVSKPLLSNYKNRGFITALVVQPRFQRQGLGKALLEKAENQLLEAGAAEIWLGPGMKHFLPGPPAEIQQLVPFFSSLGYCFDPAEKDQFDLRRNLEGWISPALPPAIKGGSYFLTQGKNGEEKAVLEFLIKAFPGRWLYETELFFRLGGSPCDITLVKSREGKIEGFLMSYHRESEVIGPGISWNALLGHDYGGIGPLGVSKAVRGQGIGTALVAGGIDYLRVRGVKDCVIDWTDLLGFYGQLGFYPWKRYRSAHKVLNRN